jgi:sigma-B regulation protein RsbU (phosphoserine phosphatase)
LRLGRGGRIDWAAAGQHPPLHITGDQVAPLDQVPAGPPLGIIPDERYETTSCQLNPGEKLIAFTDGIFEASNRLGKQFGAAGIKRSLVKLTHVASTSEALLDALIEDVKGHMEGLDFEDDFTLIAIERRID